MTNLAEAIQNACEIARQDEREKFKEYLEKKLMDIRKENCCGPHGVGFNQGKQNIIKEIINEFFKEETV